MANFLKIDIDIKFPTTRYRNMLRKFYTLLKYCATVGIHKREGLKKVIRRYNKTTSKGKNSTRIAGKSHRMNVAKLAYQNEFGAEIHIKPLYKTIKKTTKDKYITPTQRITRRWTRLYSQAKPMKEQGYFLRDKAGNFVAYFRPNSKIHIPQRSFIRSILRDNDQKIRTLSTKKIQDVFYTNTNARQAFDYIARLVKIKMQLNVRNYQGKQNHDLTVKAKGRNRPLVDENGILYKSIKYKVYKNISNIEGRGYTRFTKNVRDVKVVDKLLKSASQFEKLSSKDDGFISSSFKDSVFNYKRGNPHFTTTGYW